MIDAWDDWIGHLALEGVDPRAWDLNTMLSAFEVTLKKSAKDDATWRRTHAEIYAEPREVQIERRRQVASGQAPAGGMRMDEAEAMLARFAASDAMFGAG